MNKITQVVRKLAAVPIFGNLFLLVISFSPLILAFMLKVSLGLALIIGGLGMAAVCYFLKHKNIINILIPGGIPVWILGLVLTALGVYSLISNAFQ